MRAIAATAALATTAYHVFWTELCWKSRTALYIFVAVFILELVSLRVHP